MPEFQIKINERIPAILNKPILSNNKKCPGMLLFHGLSPSGKNEVGDLYISLSQELEKIGIASLRIDFTGWGDSSEPTENSTLYNMLEDARESYNYLRADPSISNIIFTGFSLGGIVCQKLEAQLQETQKGCSALIMISTPWSPAKALDAMFESQNVKMQEGDEYVTVSIGGVLIKLGRGFVESINASQSFEHFTSPAKTLIIHAIQDPVTEEFFKQPKNTIEYVSLDIPNNSHILGKFTNDDKSKSVVGKIVDYCQQNFLKNAHYFSEHFQKNSGNNKGVYTSSDLDNNLTL